MKQNTLGGLVVIFFVCLIAFSLGAVFATAHIGEEFSKEILPTSLTQSSDVLQVIDEKSFIAENITVKFQTQTKVKNVKNYTNKTSTNSSSTNSSHPSYNQSNNKSHKHNTSTS